MVYTFQSHKSIKHHLIRLVLNLEIKTIPCTLDQAPWSLPRTKLSNLPIPKHNTSISQFHHSSKLKELEKERNKKTGWYTRRLILAGQNRTGED